MEINIFVFVIALLVAYYFGRRDGIRSSTLIGNSKEREDDSDYYDEETELYAVDGVEEDTWEGGFWEAKTPKTIDTHLFIAYENGNGIRSTRSVRVKSFDNDLYGGILIGHCGLRDATRTFRFNRILSCSDLGTKREVEDIGAYLNELYEKSPGRTAELLVSDYKDVLKILYFVAKADGQYRKEEKEVILQYVRELLRDERISTEMVDQSLNQIDVPSLQSFKLAVGRMFKSGNVDPSLLVEICKDIIDTQSTIHPMEKLALEYLDRKRDEFTEVMV